MTRPNHLRVVDKDEKPPEPESPNPVLVIVGADLSGVNINAHMAGLEAAGFIERVDKNRWRLTPLGNQACAIMMTLAVNDANIDKVDVSETGNLHAYLLGMEVT